jgi:phenylpropionate dioxygenase-like ring-hydroxylating dioxygenase large terminal subunit
MRQEQNDLITRIGPGTPCGTLMRHYWQPVALLDEFDPALDPTMGVRPVKAVRVLGQDLVLFRDAPQNGQPGKFGLLDRDCPHRGADLSFGRREPAEQGGGLRCPFHGWKFAPSGQCLETPAEPLLPGGRKFCEGVTQRGYPLLEKAGILFAWLGPENSTPPPFPEFDCFRAPALHSFAFKGLWSCNWLQAMEVGIDPAHPSFLHVYLDDEPLDQTGDNAAGRQFRSASAGAVNGERWPMSRIMREFNQPEIRVEPTDFGMRLTALRHMGARASSEGGAELTHVRVTNAIFPHTFVIPLSETLTITQIHLPVDDTHTYWYSIFTSYTGPLDQHAMRQQRLKANPAPLFLPVSGRHNHWGFNAEEQQSKTFLGMGEEDINVHDQWACESMGPIADRTREHLGQSDKAIVANRRMLAKAIETVQAGGMPPGVANAAVAAQSACGPDTVDGIAPTEAWDAFWRTTAATKRANAAWLANPAALPATP